MSINIDTTEGLEDLYRMANNVEFDGWRQEILDWVNEVVDKDNIQKIKAYSSPTWTNGRYCDTCGFDIKENTSVCGCTEVNKRLNAIRANLRTYGWKESK